MIITKIINKFYKDSEDELFGLIGICFTLSIFFGLLLSTIYSLWVSLIGGFFLAFALSSFASKFVRGLIIFSTTIMGLGFIHILIHFNKIFPFIHGFFPILFLILGILVIAEIMFIYMPKEKVKKKDLFWHTCKRKFENIFEVILGLSLITSVYVVFRELDILKHLDVILKWIGYIMIGILVIVIIALIFYGWIKLNSFKYKK